MAQNGNWSNNDGWPGTAPGQQAGDCVIIPNIPTPVTVIYDVINPPPYPMAQLLVNGTLKFKTNGSVGDEYKLRAFFIGVNDSGTVGTLQIGVPSTDPFPSKATIITQHRFYDLVAPRRVNHIDRDLHFGEHL